MAHVAQMLTQEPIYKSSSIFCFKPILLSTHKLILLIYGDYTMTNVLVKLGKDRTRVELSACLSAVNASSCTDVHIKRTPFLNNVVSGLLMIPKFFYKFSIVSS